MILSGIASLKDYDLKIGLVRSLDDTILRKLLSMRALTKTDISEATVGVRRPMSTTFEDLFKGYNIVVYMKIRIQEKKGQNNPTMQQRRFLRGHGSAQVQLRLRPSGLKSKGCFVGPFSILYGPLIYLVRLLLFLNY